jgi:glycerol-3-phosphate acyltransferase PlsY
MKEFFILLIAYLLGSIPFAFIFSKLKGKNILEVGWRKSSASNVFYEVGFLPAFFAALGDIGKGALAVFLAKYLNLSPLFQALTGVFAILGHNWSIFLKFAGGRGIATFLGALLVFSPRILFLSLIPFLLLALIFHSGVGTIFFIFTSFLLFFIDKNPLWIFPLLSSVLIFLKRLSPVKELSWEKKEIIFNRLIFDADSPLEGKFPNLLKKLIKF